MDIQYDVNAHSHNSSIQKKKTETERKRENRERGIRKKHEKQECKHRSASRDAPPADQKKVQTARNKNTPTILEMSSACQRKRQQGRQHDNSGISKQIEHAHDLNEHWKFCVKIYMQLSVSTILQGCAEKFIGHRAVAGDSSLTEKIECVMPAAASAELQTHISNDKRIRFTAMVIQ